MISYKKTNNDFEYIEVINRQAKAKIALQGAHIFHYQAIGKPSLLWLSEKAFFKKGKAIRGGIPICFPWFGPHQSNENLPQHGFARTSIWSVVSTKEIHDDLTHLQLELYSNKASLKLWKHHFSVRLDIMIGAELSMAMTVTNRDHKDFTISTALHSYFNVSSIQNVVVKGLKNSTYFDALDKQEYVQKSDLSIKEEIDRVYFGASNNIILNDKSSNISLCQEGSNSLVVWNPWIEKSKQMADMQDNGYENMLCLETGNIARDAQSIEAGKSHTLKVVITMK